MLTNYQIIKYIKFRDGWLAEWMAGGQAGRQARSGCLAGPLAELAGQLDGAGWLVGWLAVITLVRNESPTLGITPPLLYLTRFGPVFPIFHPGRRVSKKQENHQRALKTKPESTFWIQKQPNECVPDFGESWPGRPASAARMV